MRPTTAWQSVDDGSTVLERVAIERRDLRDDDIAVRVDYCGVCHSDLHRIRGMLGEGAVVPGHEFTGTVTAAGTAVTGLAPGDRVAVGTLVDSCGTCPMCQVGQENYCYEGPVSTYGGTDRVDGTKTRGGYSREYVLREKFAYRLPGGLDPAAAAPLMCAGISMWEPMRAAGVGPGSRVAVAGLGGLGHLGVKLAAALGAEVTVLSRTPGKAADARGLGAADLLLTTDEARARQARGRFDLVLDTVSAAHDLSPLLSMVGLDGTLSVLGYPTPTSVRIMELAIGRKKLSSSGTGGRRETAEMLAFCAEHGIAADVEVLPSSRVQEALERLDRGDVRYRFVLDLSDLDRSAS
ncbi:NAD(P)-dependent alcohol dehydrogenase [Actinomadura madurae]|uniref:NAD(P)-dependent alcohol dehydrogenase n=1 Tax=Actinomadura madurae TaxID=1993 RepID=UPI0020269CA3|nr:NAD(P)-dependent alcohol dehydrogenase [Actinomadura madurae]MCP9951782.1 NAD(P)-dependent alcohol dehydrogenase [Actinomadura madurae]MCP9968552.1 NAD(P)-dependent alcohol dehydrogenase [Actinomadura madurae]MCP9981021.1 NAD(P)-dependent alcohol dehydrogenase [Actinomadura madurae]MCQ0007477.1 NAD(P)-dependent alcohol dehydrogenase [Actinomadura madurae]MCQ0017219.1 NAD(P)-dependent alcohol dehydrogenase [Actinomadura madurae]